MKASSLRRRGGRFPMLAALIAVMMNGVGALIVLAVYMALSARGFSAKISTPLVSAADTSPVMYECRGNTVFNPGMDELRERTHAAFSRCVGADPSRFQSCKETLAARPVHNDFYTAKPLALQCPGQSKPIVGMTLEAIPDAKGESTLELQDPDSVFRRELSRLDAKKVHLIFVVRGDSFDVFHAARKIARQAGFRAGWEPFESKMELAFGCGGGQSGFRQLPQ